MLLVLALILCSGGCSEGTSESGSTGGVETSGTERLGPETMPDSEAQPLEFLYWRVDKMFAEYDGDGDGKLSEKEFIEDFAGEPYNFERLDTNSDGFLVKKELIDDMVPVLREEGRIQ